MTQNERLDFLLRCLLAERGEHADIRVPDSISEKRRLLRSLMNVRPPVPASDVFLAVQDAYLTERLAKRGVTRLSDLTPVHPGLYLWRGDITTLAADAIVNAKRDWNDKPRQPQRMKKVTVDTFGVDYPEPEKV